MTIRATIWDLGGVLIRTEDRAPRTALADRYQMSYETLEDLFFGNERHEMGKRAQLGEITAAEAWDSVRRTLNASPEEMPAIRRAFFAGDRLDRELVGYIRSLRPEYKIGAISNAIDDVRGRMEAEWEIADAFDDIVISAEVGIMKPDPRIYQLSLAHLGLAPRQAVFIDDSLRNIEAAKKLGLAAVHFHSPQQVLQELGRWMEGDSA